MKKKVIAILMLTSLVCGSVMGCGSGKEETASNGEGASEEPVVLKWQSWDPASKYQPIIDAYQEANPNVTIEYEQVSDYETKINTEASGDALPDILSCKVGNTQMFAEEGILDEIDLEALKSDSDYNLDDFWETTLDYASYQGKTYGIPVDGGNYAWIYNKKMFDQLGIE